MVWHWNVHAHQPKQQQVNERHAEQAASLHDDVADKRISRRHVERLQVRLAACHAEVCLAIALLADLLVR